jgi:hypothetical protein
VVPNPNVDLYFSGVYHRLSPQEIQQLLQFKIQVRFTKNQDAFDTLFGLQKLSDNCYVNYFIPVLSWKNPDTTLVGEIANGAAVSSAVRKR